MTLAAHAVRATPAPCVTDLPGAAADTADISGFGSSGNSPPTLHLLGPGLVGRAFLPLAARCGLRVIGVTDSTATVFAREGLDALAVAAHKAHGRPLAQYDGGQALSPELAVALVAADVVVDATPSDVRRPEAAVQRALRVLSGGSRLVLASKAALAAAPDRLLAPELLPRLGFDAVLGGTGSLLRDELPELRRTATGTALVANASTTAVLLQIERGRSLEEGIARAQELGALEPDPSLDLDGSDAAAKLAVVAGALWNEPLPLDAIVREDLRHLDLDLVRWRHAHGRTTRLVGRAGAATPAAVRYEEVPLGSPLAVPPDRVAYTYALAGAAATRRVHIGAGIGPTGTAAGLLRDVLALTTGGAR